MSCRPKTLVTRKENASGGVQCIYCARPKKLVLNSPISVCATCGKTKYPTKPLTSEKPVICQTASGIKVKKPSEKTPAKTMGCKPKALATINDNASGGVKRKTNATPKKLGNLAGCQTPNGKQVKKAGENTPGRKTPAKTMGCKPKVLGTIKDNASGGVKRKTNATPKKLGTLASCQTASCKQVKKANEKTPVIKTPVRSIGCRPKVLVTGKDNASGGVKRKTNKTPKKLGKPASCQTESGINVIKPSENTPGRKTPAKTMGCKPKVLATIKDNAFGGVKRKTNATPKKLGNLAGCQTPNDKQVKKSSEKTPVRKTPVRKTPVRTIGCRPKELETGKDNASGGVLLKTNDTPKELDQEKSTWDIERRLRMNVSLEEEERRERIMDLLRVKEHFENLQLDIQDENKELENITWLQILEKRKEIDTLLMDGSLIDYDLVNRFNELRECQDNVTEIIKRITEITE